MDYKKEIADKLRNYTAMQQSLIHSANEIKRLLFERDSIRSAMSDGTPVSGGTNKREDRLINNIAMRSEMEQSRDNAIRWLDNMNAALAQLDPEEMKILDVLYIHRQKNGIDRLMDELHIEKNTVYYRRDKALRHFALLFYGDELRL